jgi:hypothetical protein
MPRLYYQMKNRPVVFFSLIAVTIACLVVLIVEFDRRHSLYWYDVGSDYSYTFDSADVTAVPVRITGEGIRIPSLPGNWDTVVNSDAPGGNTDRRLVRANPGSDCRRSILEADFRTQRERSSLHYAGR